MTGVKINDHEYWMTEFRKGTEQGFNWFFDLHNKSLAYFAIRLTAEEGQAEEIVSDCFFKLWQKRADFETPSNIKAFLFISCRNACLNYLEKLKVRNAAQQEYMHHLQISEQSILNEVIQTGVLDLVNKEIEALPEKMKLVFKLLYLDGKSTAEIAAQLGVSIQTIRNQKTRAVELIKTELLKKGISTAVYLAFLFFIENR